MLKNILPNIHQLRIIAIYLPVQQPKKWDGLAWKVRSGFKFKTIITEINKKSTLAEFFSLLMELVQFKKVKSLAAYLKTPYHLLNDHTLTKLQ